MYQRHALILGICIHLLKTVIDGRHVEIVESKKYLGLKIENKLTFKSNNNTIYMKCQQQKNIFNKIVHV